MDELAIERVLDILRPARGKVRCLREVGLAILAIRAVVITATERQLKGAAKKLIAAHQALEEVGPPFNRDERVRWLVEFGRLLAQFAAIKKGRGRDRAIAYRRKYTAAQRAFLLLLRWRPHRPPTLDVGGDFFELTAALYEEATGKEAGELMSACTSVMHEAKKEEGYQPNKPDQFLKHVRASQDYYWSMVERFRPGLRRQRRGEQLREADRLVGATHHR